VAELLTHATLRRLAGARSFERGEEYAATDAVGSLQWDESSIRAGVQGAERYRVRLELAGGGLAGSCTCPVGRDGFFCKHCVAVGLAWLGRGQDVGEPAAAPTRSELRDRLAALDAEALADLLVEEALDDERGESERLPQGPLARARACSRARPSRRRARGLPRPARAGDPGKRQPHLRRRRRVARAAPAALRAPRAGTRLRRARPRPARTPSRQAQPDQATRRARLGTTGRGASRTLVAWS
jgi:hypothetical protein